MIDFKKYGSWGRRKKYQAIIALVLLLRELEIYPLETFKAAVSLHPEYAEENLAAINAASGIIK
jgi:hypothetical protein